MIGNNLLVEALAALVAEGGVLETVTIHLTKDDYAPNASVTAAQLAEHEADYTGYAASAAIDWLAPYVNALGDGVIPAASVQFQPSGSATANMIYGYWLQTGTGGSAKVRRFVALPDPVPMGSTLHSLIVQPSIQFPQE